MATWTAYAVWDDDETTVEEIDVVAEVPVARAVRPQVVEILNRDYRPGWKILGIVKRPPGMSYP